MDSGSLGWGGGRDALAYEPDLRRYLHTQFCREVEIDDVVQEAYLRLFRTQKRQPIRCFRSFLFITARNLALDVIRRRNRNLFKPLTTEIAEAVSDGRECVTVAAHRKQVQDLVNRAIERLPNRSRTVTRLFRIDEVPQKEIARRLGVSRHTIENQVAYGTKACAAFLREHGIAHSAS